MAAWGRTTIILLMVDTNFIGGPAGTVRKIHK